MGLPGERHAGSMSPPPHSPPAASEAFVLSTGTRSARYSRILDAVARVSPAAVHGSQVAGACPPVKAKRPLSFVVLLGDVAEEFAAAVAALS